MKKILALFALCSTAYAQGVPAGVQEVVAGSGVTVTGTRVRPIVNAAGGGGGTVTGTGTAPRLAFWSGVSAISSDADLTWDAGTNTLKMLSGYVGAPSATTYDGVFTARKDSASTDFTDPAQFTFTNENTTANNYAMVSFSSSNGVGSGPFARVGAQFTDHTNGTEDADLIYMTVQNGDLLERWRMGSDGTLSHLSSPTGGRLETLGGDLDVAASADLYLSAAAGAVNILSPIDASGVTGNISLGGGTTNSLLMDAHDVSVTAHGTAGGTMQFFDFIGNRFGLDGGGGFFVDMSSGGTGVTRVSGNGLSLNVPSIVFDENATHTIEVGGRAPSDAASDLLILGSNATPASGDAASFIQIEPGEAGDGTGGFIYIGTNTAGVHHAKEIQIGNTTAQTISLVAEDSGGGGFITLSTNTGTIVIGAGDSVTYIGNPAGNDQQLKGDWQIPSIVGPTTITDNVTIASLFTTGIGDVASAGVDTTITMNANLAMASTGNATLTAANATITGNDSAHLKQDNDSLDLKLDADGLTFVGGDVHVQAIRQANLALDGASASLKLQTQGANRIVIDDGGNISIGETGPTLTVPMTTVNFTGTGNVTVSGNVALSTAGKSLRVAEGTNACQGASTLSSGTVVVSTTCALTNSRIMLTAQNAGGTVGFYRISTRTNATSFTITSSNVLDTSLVAWEIFN